MNTSFYIEENQVSAAQLQCAEFEDNNIACRSTASGVAAQIAENFFANTGFDVDIESSLYTEEIIAKECEISDIYVNGNYVDVRVYFDEKEISVPKYHFDNDILPLAYMFVKVSNDLTKAEVTGFILPDVITRIDDIDDYYPVNENVLVPFEEIEYLFKPIDDLYNVENSDIFDFIENPNVLNIDLIEKLLRSKEGRVRFKKINRAQSILNLVEIPSGKDVNTVSEDDYFSSLLQGEEQSINTAEEESDYNYSTVASPKFNFDEELANDGIKEENILEESEEEAFEETSESVLKESDLEQVVTDEESQEQPIETEEINTLFENDNNEEIENSTVAKKRGTMLPLIIILLIISGCAYWGYTKYGKNENTLPNTPATEVIKEEDVKDTKPSDAMPNETIEKSETIASKNEGNSVSIPAIEQNLDASVLVSNLRVEWDVPVAYTSNTQAYRYIQKMTKILQLNLKAELLLLNKPPISNRISLELKYNPSTKLFEIVDFVTSSGEKTVDDLIYKTLDSTLKSKLNINTEIFGKLSGNPIIIIKL